MIDSEPNSADVEGVPLWLSRGRIPVGLSLLREALVLARETRSDVWQFAVEIAELRAFGLQHTDLRWLVSEGYAEHAEERTKPRDKKRRFLKVENLAFGRSTCFVLTARGVDLARVFTVDPGLDTGSARSLQPVPAKEPLRPHWDVYRRELTWNDRVIKKFRLPAENQERILAAFEEDGWPVRIDDPLRRAYEIDPKTRLHESIKALNRNQVLPLLRFFGDGTGQGVVWGPCSPRAHTDLPQSDHRSQG